MDGLGLESKLSDDRESDARLSASSGAINTNSDYSRSRENSPGGSDNNPELAEYLDKIEQIYKDIR